MFVQVHLLYFIFIEFNNHIEKKLISSTMDKHVYGRA